MQLGKQEIQLGTGKWSTIASMNRRSAALLPLLLSIGAHAADVPQGKFQCRRFPLDGISGYANPVAYLWLQPNGGYELLDLTITTGKTSGHYTYDAKKHEIDWTDGELSKYVGHYVPKIQGTALIRLNTRKDPAGRIDGTMPCIRVRDDDGTKSNKQ